MKNIHLLLIYPLFLVSSKAFCMKLIKQSKAHTKQNNAVCAVTEYPFGDKDLDMALVKLTGRYPESGWALNEQCKEICYIIAGNGTITFGNTTLQLAPGDVVIVEKNKKYFWDGTLDMVLATHPAWYPQQHKIIPDSTVK